MAKKLSLLMAAVAVIAFAVPAAASASKITMPANQLVPVGTTLTAVSTNTETTTESLGNLVCEKVDVGAEVTKNDGTTVTAKGAGAAVTTKCFDEGEPITITDPTLLSLTTTGTTHSGTVGLTFIADLPAGIVCHFAGTAVPFTYVAGSDSIHVAGQILGTPVACGNAEIHGDFTVTTTSNAKVEPGKPVIFD